MKQKGKKIILLRIVLGILIVLNMAVIFTFSSQNSTDSKNISDVVGSAVADGIGKDFENQTPGTQTEPKWLFLQKVRKGAHILEFGSLAGLVYLLLLTWSGSTFLKFFGTVGFSFFYALTDEFHQQFVDGRSMSLRDAFIDLIGILSVSLLILIICFFVRRDPPRLKTTVYKLTPKDPSVHLRIAVASDLHGNPNELPLRHLRNARPDLILIPGDLMDDADLRRADALGYEFLRACSAIAPTYYSLGNHELACYHKGNPWRHPIPLPLDNDVRDRIAQTGAVLLDNDSATFADRVHICGLTSGINGAENKPNECVLGQFAALDGVRILMCHHPEYFVPYIQSTTVDLVVCGHAHGGHWRFFGRGVYAPGQGLLPKYTAGVIDHRCVISRGMGDHTRISRIFNTPELVVIEFGS